MKRKKQKPEWTPDNADSRWAGKIVEGVEGGHDGLPGGKTSPSGNPKRKILSDEDYIEGVLKGDRGILARTITLIESNASEHMERGQNVLNRLLQHTGQSIRIGISGVPGAGKSTFIETLGLRLIDEGHRVAVLAIDPSSSVTRGSILGDKTRMEKLSQAEQSFIRPSPSGGTLGGVARKTRETILVCEAAGFDVILVETIGVGQSEITVRSMVDFFILLQIAGAGDELQGIKKGVIELADLVLINKADGENKIRAEAAKQDLETALHYLPQSTRGWKTPVRTCSALTGQGISAVWQDVTRFAHQNHQDGRFRERRKLQSREWLQTLLQEQLMEVFNRNEGVVKRRERLEKKVIKGEITATKAATQLIEDFVSERKKRG